MDKMLEIVKIVAILQISIVALFIVLMYCAKLYTYFQEKRKGKNREQITNLFKEHLKKQEPLSSQDIHQCKSSIRNVLLVAKEVEVHFHGTPQLASFKKQLSDEVLKPAARKMSHSKRWFKRYIASLCYYYGFDKGDESRLVKMLNDSAALVSINAGICIIKSGEPHLINQMITAFSRARRLQQSTFSAILSHDKCDISPIILERLETEQDTYVKVFCYRLLSKIPQQTVATSVRRDLEIESTDLKIAVLDYLTHTSSSEKNDLIYNLAASPSWEVRAVVAKALGGIPGERSTELLNGLLNDKQQWVRINAVKSLSQQGESGMQILRELSPQKDKFAYDTAQILLMTMENQ